MPRKSTSDSPAPRRVSARIAAAVVTKPATTPSPAKKTTPKRTKKAAVKEDEEKSTSEINGTDQVSNDTSITEDIAEPAIKKQKTEDSEKPSDTNIDSKHEAVTTEAVAVNTSVSESKVHEDSEKSESIPDVHIGNGITNAKVTEPEPMANSLAPATELGFEVIDKSTVPSSDSEEVKAAVTAQGEDGELLVDFVQVTKDEVPAPDAVADIVPEVKVLSPEKRCDTNGVDTSISLHGDNGTNQISQSPKKVDEIAHDKVEAIVPPQQDMHAEL